MTQTPKQPIYKYTAIPTDEHFNPDRPSLELACRGNRTMGNILNFLVSRASYIAENKKLESCKVVTINVARDEILKAIRISEKTYIIYLKELNELHYIDSRRYARREYDINFEAINEGIKNPPAQKLRGRPKGSKKRCESGSNKSEENASTLQENTSTYVLELENKVEALNEKVKVLESKVESIRTFEKELELLRKVLQLSQSDESIPQALREAFSKPLDVLDVNKITIDNVVDVRSREIDAPTSSSFKQETDSSVQLPIADDTSNAPVAIVPIGNTASLIEKACYTTPDEYAACLQVFLEALGTQWKAMDKATRGLWSVYKQEKLDAWKAINPKPAKPKPVLLAEEKALQHELQEWINKKRGYKLHGRAPAKEIFAEQNAVQTLAHMLYEQLFLGNEEDGATWEELTFEWEHIKKHDPYWSKPDNRVRIGGFALLQKFAPVIHDYRSTKKGASNGHANKEPSAAVAAGYTDYTNTPPTNYKPLPRKRA